MGLQHSASHTGDASERSLGMTYATNNLIQGASNSQQLDMLNTIGSVQETYHRLHQPHHFCSNSCTVNYY